MAPAFALLSTASVPTRACKPPPEPAFVIGSPGLRSFLRLPATDENPGPLQGSRQPEAPCLHHIARTNRFFASWLQHQKAARKLASWVEFEAGDPRKNDRVRGNDSIRHATRSSGATWLYLAAALMQ